ncbi:hypothetical protein CC79DRAFT_1332810 [Sarocladium strictum]
MSPVVSRIATKAAPAFRRQFSIRAGLRQITRTMEPHPHGRRPASGISQPGDLPQELARVSKIALVFFPAIGTLLAWPIGAKALWQGHM